MSIRNRLAAAMFAGLSFSAMASADLVMIGHANGMIGGRSELDLATNIPSTFINLGGPASPEYGVTAMASGFGKDLAFGTGTGIPRLRQADDMVTVGATTGKFTGGATSSISAMAIRPNGDVVIGTEDNQVFVRDRTNLLSLAPSYTGGSDGANYDGSTITALAVLPSGNIVVGTQSGLVIQVSGTDVFSSVSSVNFGVAITALSAVNNGNIVIGTAAGNVDTRDANNLLVSLSNANFGVAINDLATFSSGNVAIAMANGAVEIRHESTMGTVLSGAVFYTGAAGVTALAVTSNDNLAIGTGDANGFVYMSQELNLGTAPVGFTGTNGITFGAPVTSLAAVIPEPATLGLIGLGCLMMLPTRR